MANIEMKSLEHDLIYVALGSNLDFDDLDSKALLSKAIAAINGAYDVIAVSSKYISPPWPVGTKAPDYWNMVIAIKGAYSPFALMKKLLKIEKNFGRVRNLDNKNASRTLDLDIIDFKGRKISEIKNDIELCIPHERLSQRDFVLLPLFEIAPDWKHPENGTSIEALMQQYLRQNHNFTAKVCSNA